MSKSHKIQSTIGFLDRSLEVIAVTCLVISILLNIGSVFLRYGLDMSFPIVDELCRYTIIYGVFLYIGPLIKKNEHLNMNMLQERLKGKVKISNDLFISIILFATFVTLCWSSIQWTVSLLSMEVRTVSGIMLMFIPALALPIGMVFGSLYSFLQILQEVKKLRQAKEHEIVSLIDTIELIEPKEPNVGS